MTLSDISAKTITSTQNPKYKLWKKYLREPAGTECPWLAVEGRKQVLELAGKRTPELLLLRSGSDPSGLEGLLRQSRSLYYLPERLMKGLSGVENNQGIIGFFPKPAWTESDLTGRVIALEGIQDPGNLGTVIRTAAALGGFSIISSGSGVSFYNPKVVRASAGYLFSVPFLSGLSHRDLVRKGYHLWYACPSEGIPLPETELEVPLAILFGSEGSGLDRDNIAAEGRKLMIPMNGEMDSLNVAVASSIVMYEINRRSMINNAQG